MRIGGLQKTTLIDFPGKMACTVFLTGCNFRCPFCYSKELVLPSEILKQPVISEKEFFDFLKERKEFLEGVVLCGGEPTVSSELPQFVKKIKKIGYLIKLDSNGSNPETIKRLINEKLVDYIAMDIKAPLELKSQSPNSKSQTNSKFQISKYEQMTGVKVNLEDIKKSVEILKQRKVDFEFRTTVAPGLTRQDIIDIADWLAGENVKYFLQEFSRQKPVLNPEILKMPTLQFEEIEKIIKEIKDNFKICQLR